MRGYIDIYKHNMYPNILPFSMFRMCHCAFVHIHEWQQNIAGQVFAFPAMFGMMLKITPFHVKMVFSRQNGHTYHVLTREVKMNL